jgi:tRNA dimethylallyltransferase
VTAASSAPRPAPLVAIVGATGTGKSELALDLAAALAERGRRAEVVNADAMQLYRGMDIGTAKLPESERRGITHHMLDVLEPTDDASVAEYQRDARAIVTRLQADGVIPLLTGGSGLYVSSVIQDFAFPARDEQVRTRLEGDLERLGPAGLHARLACLDPAAATQVDPANGRRIVRALEVVELEGSFTPGLPEHRPPWQDATVLALRADRDVLVPRLEARVRRMWADGLVDEVEALRPAGFGTTAGRAIGYAQAIAQLDGMMDEATAIAETAALTRRYARRQVSWFRRDRSVQWIEHDDPARIEFALGAVLGED